MKPHVGVSACLLGERVRHDGGHKHAPLIVEALGSHVEWVPVCPEVELGLGVPREPIALQGEGGGVRLVGIESGADLTARMARYCAQRLGTLGPLAGFVFKSKSPSCAVASAERLEAGRVVSRAETGLFAAAVRAAWPDLPVAEEGELTGAEALERFLERVRRRARHLS